MNWADTGTVPRMFAARTGVMKTGLFVHQEIGVGIVSLDAQDANKTAPCALGAYVPVTNVT